MPSVCFGLLLSGFPAPVPFVWLSDCFLCKFTILGGLNFWSSSLDWQNCLLLIL